MGRVLVSFRFYNRFCVLFLLFSSGGMFYITSPISPSLSLGVGHGIQSSTGFPSPPLPPKILAQWISTEFGSQQPAAWHKAWLHQPPAAGPSCRAACRPSVVSGPAAPWRRPPLPSDRCTVRSASERPELAEHCNRRNEPSVTETVEALWTDTLVNRQLDSRTPSRNPILILTRSNSIGTFP